MKEYLRWSLHQLFLLYFQPSRFHREVEGIRPNDAEMTWRERLSYMLKMLPVMIVFVVSSNLLTGQICELFGVPYRWLYSWNGVAVSMALGVGVGVGSGVVGGVAGGVLFGLVGSVAGGVAFWLTYFRLFVYPFDVCLSICAWALRKKPQEVRRAWRLCSISWNEVIWLPLPYTARLLTLLAQVDREEGLRQIAFVASERKLQRRVALTALQEVALGDLRANTLPDMIRVAEKLS
jgi:hypothetical protein